LKIGQKIDSATATDFRSQLDRVLTHKVWGYLIFFVVLFGIFQSIFVWSKIPMDFIDRSFASLSTAASENLPAGAFTNLIAQGIIPGIAGILMFIPQITFLFLFISILEESGYMSRVVFLMDKIMRRFGLSGKSVVPLISGTACAIPAIMATRNIENWKERLITILVTPFTTCSARLPVYAIIIGLVIPDEYFLGILNLQGLTLMLLYLIGFGVAILSAYILNKVLQLNCKTFFVVEMPNYKLPLFKNVMITVIEKTKAIVFGAGKIILAISVILWFLASNGPSENFKNAATIITSKAENKTLSAVEIENKVASFKLENSYIGLMGKTIEPAISPLGYDWKIGVAIISSFAAREVFVGTLATIYSVGGSENETTIKTKMAKETNPETGEKIFNFASGISLLLFYAFALQCISTLAVTKKETNSWKWPLGQLLFMSSFAYIIALIAYQLLK
jgi:ferrous iron transport protein B